jgi:hypothetical protein
METRGGRRKKKREKRGKRKEKEGSPDPPLLRPSPAAG